MTSAGVKRSLEDTVPVQSDQLSINEYNGFQPPIGVTLLSDRVPATLEPIEFFEQYVKLRRPAVISGLSNADNEQWKVNMWSHDYLMNKAGSSTVYAEDWKETEIGDGCTEIKYEDLINCIVGGETKYNLTTVDSPVSCSELDLNDDVMSSTIVEPLPVLLDDFPCRPSLLGNLVVRRIALCQGLSGMPIGLSTGLRHDYNDQFCLLLRGRKRFRLFSPSFASRLLTPGCPLKVYSNGLLVYLPKHGKKGSEAVKMRADGAPFEAIARQKRDDADKDLSEAEKKLYRLRRVGTSERLTLEKAMDVVNECENRLETANEELHKYDSDSEDEEASDKSDDVISIHDDESEPETAEEPASKISKLMMDESSLLLENGQENGDYQGDICLSAEDCQTPDELFAKCQQLKDIPCMVVDLLPGELLYIPASWFYEVTTYDSATSDEASEQQQQQQHECDPAADDSSVNDGQPGHLSLVYWSFPPSNDQFDQPYCDQFWDRRWKKFEKERQIMHRRSKLISSDVISLNSESSDNSSCSSSDDEDDENENETVAQQQSPQPSNKEDSNLSVSIEEIPNSAVERSAILVGDDDSDIDCDEDTDAEDDDDDDSDVIHLDSTHQETSTSEQLNSSSIILAADEDDISWCDAAGNKESPVVVDEDNDNGDAVLDDLEDDLLNSPTDKVQLAGDDNKEVASGGEKNDIEDKQIFEETGFVGETDERTTVAAAADDDDELVESTVSCNNKVIYIGNNDNNCGNEIILNR